MWQHSPVNRHQQRSGHRLTIFLPASRPQLQRSNFLNVDDITRSLGKASLRNHSAVHSTTSHLSSRRSEISNWQGRISFIIVQVDKEITLLEQMKQSVEGYLENIQAYSQLTKKNTLLSDSVNPTIMKQDIVFTELQKEQKQIEYVGKELKSLLYILGDKQSSLSHVRAQLHLDVLDKREAIDLTTKCLTQPANVFYEGQPMAPHRCIHVSYDQWLSHCKNLKSVAERQMNDASTFRVKLRSTLLKLRNAQKHQQRCITDSLKKCIYQQTRVQQKLTAERKQVMQNISHLTRDMQRMENQTRNSKSKLQEVCHRLEMLNQRQRYELCQDHSFNHLTKEKFDWNRAIIDLQRPLKQFEKNLQFAETHLSQLSDKIFEKAQAVKMLQSFLYQYETFAFSHPNSLYFNMPIGPMHKF